MIKDSVTRRIVQEKAGATAFQEKKWLGFKARCRAGSDNLVVSSCSIMRSSRFLEVSPT